MNESRRTILTAAAWSLPVIAAAVAAPASTASAPQVPQPMSCHKIKHAGPNGHQWAGTWTDGTVVTMTNSDAMSGPFGQLCRTTGADNHS